MGFEGAFQCKIAPKVWEIWRYHNIWKCSESCELFEKRTFRRTSRKNSSQGSYMWNTPKKHDFDGFGVLKMGGRRSVRCITRGLETKKHDPKHNLLVFSWKKTHFLKFYQKSKKKFSLKIGPKCAILWRKMLKMSSSHRKKILEVNYTSGCQNMMKEGYTQLILRFLTIFECFCNLLLYFFWYLRLRSCIL